MAVASGNALPPTSQRSLVAVDLGGTKCLTVLVADDGRLLHTEMSPTSANEAGGQLVDAVSRMVETAHQLGRLVDAAVIAIPAFIDPESQLAVGGPNLAWNGYDLLGVLRMHLTVPFEVHNDVNLAALGEASFGHGQNVRSFVTLSLGTGVGAALVLNGDVWIGAHHAAGEVGLLRVVPSSISTTDSTRQSARRVLEDRASGRAILERLKTIPEFGPTTFASDPGATVAALFDAANRRERTAQDVVHELIADVAATISTICAVVDPDAVVLDGSLGRSLGSYSNEINRLLDQELPYPPSLYVSDLAPTSAVRGAIARWHERTASSSTSVI